MLRVVLVDDERLARQAMRQLLREHGGVEIAGEADHADAAKELIAEKRPDAVFLDIRMPETDGFEMLEGLEMMPRVVFVTAHSEHAVRAFDVEAVDYLLKPVRPERLALAIERLEMARAGSESSEAAYRLDDRICLRTPGRTLVARLGSVAALQADGDFTRIFVAGEDPPIMICQSLGHYEKTLPNPPFLRIGRSFMLNVERIATLDRVSRDEIRLELAGVEAQFELGRKAWTRLREAGVLEG